MGGNIFKNPPEGVYQNCWDSSLSDISFKYENSGDWLGINLNKQQVGKPFLFPTHMLAL